MNTPHSLIAQEWAEVASLFVVLQNFGLEDEPDPAGWLAKYAYGVRFDYQTDCPGYVGPLYLLQGGGSPDAGPMAFVRDETGALELAEGW